MKNEVIDWYIKTRPTYKRLSAKIEALLSEVFEMENISYHIITSRTKTIESVRGKISKDKYDNPKEQIQDFAGIRIITYVEDEVAKISELIEKTFDIDHENSGNKSDDLGLDKVGYKSVHYIAHLDKSRLKLPEYKQYENKCFEIQVRTILQHTWAEIEHDRSYKYTGKLPTDIGRRFKLLAGMLEMADREFNNISNDIDAISENTAISAEKGDYNIPISSTTLTTFLSTKFSSVLGGEPIIFSDRDGILVGEMERFGLKTLDDFNKIIPDDFNKTLKFLNEKARLSDFGLVRRVLMINDYNKYFSIAKDDGFTVWTSYDDGESKFFKHYGVDWDDIEDKYGVMLTD
ncbi:GTP pyrophosphokinase family protein [Aliivibrio fischeri]|uniref:GTP pyrophosphokinase n=1 Tax=Aliivibrio fischeri TaxID=668 RepID=UPI00080E702A|nr:hypothetical protein [Aliivibrio fischeri]OCH01409.1 hypothetical protein A6E10_19260 [Aliivibrio fischeri]